jgi:hypothetical protein
MHDAALAEVHRRETGTAPSLCAEPLPYEASPPVRAIISRMGRTEDIAFSPDNSRLAVVDLTADRIFLFSVRLDHSASPPRIALLDCAVVSSPAVHAPHGIAFLGDDHFIVCSRRGGIAVFAVPSAGTVGDCQALPLAAVTDKGRLSNVRSASAAAGYAIAPGRHRLLVCSNDWHVATSHLVTIGSSVRIANRGVAIEQGLRIPDGIAVSADRAWIAVSNHADGTVRVYRNGPGLGRNTPATAVLGGIVCPHGLRFSPEGRRLFVADDAGQFIHVFDRPEGDWSTVSRSSRAIRMIDDDRFYTRHDARDGGVKGIDLDRRGAILAVTFKGAPLGFYDVAALFARTDQVDPREMRELERLRDVSLRRTKSESLQQRWTTAYRLSRIPADMRRRSLRRAALKRSRAVLQELAIRNKESHDTLLDPRGPVVSLTTFGKRLGLAFHAIESIGLGARKPSRLVLWINEDAYADRPETLRRLEARGLEARPTRDLGPHKKYYPYLESESAFALPLVTADDDVVYPPDWLEGLIAACEARPALIHCYRARRLGFTGHRLLPYTMWELCDTTTPSHLHFAIGVSGVAYPPAFLYHLKRQGAGFMDDCLFNDDIWLKANALRADVKVAQVRPRPGIFQTVEGSQVERLSTYNVEGGGNQRQLIATLTADDLALLAAAEAAEAPSA